MCVCADAASAALLAANELLRALLTQPDARIGLATGRTFAPVFAHLRQQQQLLQHAEFTHLDEYEGVRPDEAGSMALELHEALFAGTQPTLRLNMIDACGSDAAARLAALRAREPADFQFAGIGTNGHIAFNEPGTPFSAGAHVVALHADTLRTQTGRFADAFRGSRALTTGPRELLQSRRLVLLATGTSKALAVQQMLEGAVDSACPASLVRMHPDALVILDAAAAAQLTRQVDDRAACSFEVLRTLNAPGPVLCASPHPDDASISCGALLALCATADAHILCCTTGARSPVRGLTDPAAVAALRESEVQEEARLLGCHAHFLRARCYDTGALEADDVARCAQLLAHIQPAWILLPSAQDPHPTHRLTRFTLEAALQQARSLASAQASAEAAAWSPELWTFEGPWFQHPRAAINTLLHFTPETEARKLAAVRAHKSQLQRVPFDQGALALARLRGVMFSETHFGGLSAEGLHEVPLLECFVRERLS